MSTVTQATVRTLEPSMEVADLLGILQRGEPCQFSLNGSARTATTPAEIADLVGLVIGMKQQKAAASAERKITFEVSTKPGKDKDGREKAPTRALIVRGLNTRFPITLYAGQWVRFLAVVGELRQFIADHADELAWKDADAKTAGLEQLRSLNLG